MNSIEGNKMPYAKKEDKAKQMRDYRKKHKILKKLGLTPTVTYEVV